MILMMMKEERRWGQAREGSERIMKVVRMRRVELF
jgi:hypothetical protein